MPAYISINLIIRCTILLSLHFKVVIDIFKNYLYFLKINKFTEIYHTLFMIITQYIITIYRIKVQFVLFES